MREGGVEMIFIFFVVVPNVSQFVPIKLSKRSSQDVLITTTLLSHVFCPKKNSDIC
jgi:hypothetical protein